MRLILMTALCCGILSIHGQSDCTWSMYGVVLDEHDDASLGYATIYVKELELGVVSDSLGNFQISGLCAGVYTVQFSHIGCATREQIVRVRGHENIVLHLEHHAELLETIELHARKIRTAGTASRVGLDSADLLQLTGKSLGEALMQLPGVAALQTGPAIFKPMINGLHSNRILILKDGLRLESQQWGQDHAPEIDLAGAASITVIKGAAAVQYGSEAVGGVILVEAAPLPVERVMYGDVRVHASENGRQTGLASTINRGFGKGYGIRVSAAGRRSGDASAAEYLLTNTGSSELTFGIDAGYRKGLRKLGLAYEFFRSEIGILQSAHIGNLTDLLDALHRDRPLIVMPFSFGIENPRQEVLHQTMRMYGQFHSEKLGVVHAQYALQLNSREEYDIRRGGRDNTPSLDLGLLTHSASIDHSHPSNGRLRGKLGVHWTYQKNTNTPGTGVRPLIPNYTRLTPAVSWVEKWTGTRAEIEAGVRYEYVWLEVKRISLQNTIEALSFGYHNFSASAGMRYTINDHVALNTHAGSTHRAPNVSELFSEGLHHGAAAIEEGDETLTSERALKWLAGTEVRKNTWQLDASAFLQFIDDFIYLYPTGEPRLTIRGAFPVFQYVQDDVRLHGVEGSVVIMPVSWWSLNSGFSLVRGYNRSAEVDLINIPGDRMRHTVVWHGSKYSAEVALTLEHVWRQSRVPSDSDYAPPPPGYTLIHARAGLDFFQGRLRAEAGCRNLLNASYREYLNRLRYFADDTGRNIELRLRYVFK